jgi:hypothetical protein
MTERQIAAKTSIDKQIRAFGNDFAHPGKHLSGARE